MICINKFKFKNEEFVKIFVFVFVFSNGLLEYIQEEAFTKENLKSKYRPQQPNFNKL